MGGGGKSEMGVGSGVTDFCPASAVGYSASSYPLTLLISGSASKKLVSRFKLRSMMTLTLCSVFSFLLPLSNSPGVIVSPTIDIRSYCRRDHFSHTSK